MTLKPRRVAAIGLAAAAAARIAFGAGEEDFITFQKAGRQVARLSKSELGEKIQAATATFFDPDYDKEKTYRCLPMREVMDLAFGKDWRDSPLTEAVLTAADGYAAVSEAARLAEDGGCLAVADAEFPDWEPVGRRRLNPGPFYLAWSGKSQRTENGYPWPYQLVAVNLISFEDRYPEVVPRGAARNSAAYRGYRLFKERCMSCHAMNRQGGTVGPDLNAPRSIADYRPKGMIQAFIRRPSEFRYTEMPDFADLTDRDLESLYRYFLFKGKQRGKPATP